MANEIQIITSIQVTKGNIRLQFVPNSISPTLTGNPSSLMVQTLTSTNYANLTINTNVTNGGWTWFRNISTATGTTPTIYIASSLSSAAGTSFPFAALLPSEFAITRNSITSFSAKLDTTNSADLQFGILSA